MAPLFSTRHLGIIARAWLFVVVPLMIMLNAILKEEVTYGDLITITISAAVAIVMVCTWGWRQRTAARPLKVRFYGDRVHALSTQNRPTRKYALPKVDPYVLQTMYVGLTFKRGMITEEMNVRCVRRSRIFPWRFMDVPQSTIEINGVMDREHSNRNDGRWHGCKPDNQGGQYFYYNPPIQISKGGSLLLEVSVKARKPWRGYLSFMHCIGAETRGYGRGRLNVEQLSFWGRVKVEFNEYLSLLCA